VGQDKFSTAKSLTHTFDEIGCFPVKLTVKSEKNGKTDSMETMVKVENVAPVLSSLQVTIVDPNTDPVVVNVAAL
jgi:PKD repeat protein